MNEKCETTTEATTGGVPVEREVSPTPPPRTVAVLNDGNTAIVVDDHCHAIRNWTGEEWGWSSHIFPEASRVLRSLPVLPDDAERA